ncbi:hypothetical protein EYF80_019587 [Liparis tanakae]|uniref:Uncharacterized protein n=1 Tax=Liparis tanakae TaxID=230148 RepID=A0A4Z2HWI2_9TELE|nr:hypothetical protein EYF80_019587 [Liparis tanakae]
MGVGRKLQRDQRGGIQGSEGQSFFVKVSLAAARVVTIQRCNEVSRQHMEVVRTGIGPQEIVALHIQQSHLRCQRSAHHDDGFHRSD